MRYLSEFRGSGIGKTCAILGGGPSLAHDLRAIPAVDTLIGVNQHSLILPLDFVFFSDERVWNAVKDYKDILKITVLGKYDREDVICFVPSVSIGFSGARAVLAADFMSFDKIYVCGMDNYDPSSGRDYWWQLEGEPRTHEHCQNLHQWVQIKHGMSRPEAVEFVSGRLNEVFHGR
jgi:hypothetical protein